MSTPLPASRARIKQLFQKYDFDVLHVQMPYSPLLAGKVIRQAPSHTAVIGTFHVVPQSWQERWATGLLRVLVYMSKQRVDAAVSVSAPAQRFAKRWFGLLSSVVPNAVTTATFRAGKRPKKYADGKVNIVFLGRLVPRKGCYQLLKAIQQLHNEHLLAGLRVLICGKGPDLQRLQAYVKKNHLAKNVHFLGFVSEADKPNYLASADIAVFPSTGGESFGIVLVEAMAARSGVVLGGDNIGYRSVLRERPNQLVNARDVSALVKALKDFAFNAAARNKAVQWQQTQLSKYDVSTVGLRLLQLYEQVIAKRQPPKDNSKHEPKQS
jgi:phosphatidylinositol alpha-mannosyltransferase